MYRISLTSALVFCLFLAGCGAGEDSQIIAPTFITATLPSTAAPLLQQQLEATSVPLTPTPTVPPVSGSTTSQVNVRSEPSTAGESLGEIPPFTQVQIFGKETYGKWFLVEFPSAPGGKGWIAAKFVQLNNSGESPVTVAGTSQGAVGSGLVLSGINVRTGPDSTYSSLGTLLPDDVVFITSKDTNGAWLQILYKGGEGWVSAEFIQVENAGGIPMVVEETPQSSAENTVQPPVPSSARDDDSMQSPLMSVTLSQTGMRSVQFSGQVSATDMEDWVQFNSNFTSTLLDVKCAGNVIAVEIWNNGSISQGLPCDKSLALPQQSGVIYLIRFKFLENGETLIGTYTLKIKSVQ